MIVVVASAGIAGDACNDGRVQIVAIGQIGAGRAAFGDAYNGTCAFEDRSGSGAAASLAMSREPGHGAVKILRNERFPAGEVLVERQVGAREADGVEAELEGMRPDPFLEGHVASACHTRAVRTTIDALMDGAVVLEQPAPGEGYRFNVDAVLLAQFAVRGRDGVEHLIDLGAGVGPVALCVARLTRLTRATLIEMDPASCELARGNVARAGLRADVIEGDVTSVEGNADLIVCNPPYSAPHAGRASPVQGRDRARRGDVQPFLKACSRVLGAGAGACFCYPVVSMVGLLKSAEAVGLKARRAAFVHPAIERPARIVLVEFGRSGGFELEEAVVG